MQLYQITYEEFLQAYIDCRKHKRWSHSAVVFELHLEENLLQLYNDLIFGRYKISKSQAFIINDPKIREVFAANFRDRMVHHLLMNRIINNFEQYYSDSSYSCRKGRGCLVAVTKLQEIMKQHPDWYILGLDVSAFFPSIDRRFLKLDLLKFLQVFSVKEQSTYKILTAILNNNVTENCNILGDVDNWNNIPHNKTLFGRSSGIPIGDLTSQFFGNFVLTPIDIYLEYNNIQHVRYVDDLRIVGPKDVLKNIRHCIFLYIQQYNIYFNPNKIYFQSVVKGCPFLGYFITRNYILPGKRIHKRIKQYVRDFTTNKHTNFDILSKTNSYLGILQHCTCFNLRKYLTSQVQNVYKVIADNKMYKISLT